MAKRSSSEGVFTDVQYKAISRAIETMRDRAIVYKQPELTIHDVLELFVSPEHHILARDAVSLLGTTPTSYIEHKMYDPTSEGNEEICVNLHFEWAGGKPMTLPKYAGKELYHSGESYERLKIWLKWRMARGREWSLVDGVFRTLHEWATVPGVAHFYMPAISNLLSMSDERKVRAIGEAWKNLSVPKHLPAFPRSFKKACAEANHTIVRGMLLPSEVNPKKGAVWVDIDKDYQCPLVVWDEEKRMSVKLSAF